MANSSHRKSLTGEKWGDTSDASVFNNSAAILFVSVTARGKKGPDQNEAVEGILVRDTKSMKVWEMTW